MAARPKQAQLRSIRGGAQSENSADSGDAPQAGRHPEEWRHALGFFSGKGTVSLLFELEASSRINCHKGVADERPTHTVRGAFHLSNQQKKKRGRIAKTGGRRHRATSVKVRSDTWKQASERGNPIRTTANKGRNEEGGLHQRGRLQGLLIPSGESWVGKQRKTTSVGRSGFGPSGPADDQK